MIGRSDRNIYTWRCAVSLDKQTEAGHQVVAEAPNGIERYREYAKHRPDLVTMDITMPVMNGIEALKKYGYLFRCQSRYERFSQRRVQ